MTSIAEERFQAAIDDYWVTREAQTAKQMASGRVDAGTRGSVTGGAHLHALTALIGEVFIENGFSRHSIKHKGMELPGFYRPTKNWDLVVIEEDILVAAIELKSQVGSLGNNFNNRTEEAIGNAIDLRRAYQAGSLGRVPPWLGYVFVLEESPRASNPVRIAATPFIADAVFAGTSYKDRYQILCRRLVSDGLYDAACFVTSSRAQGARIAHPDPALSFAALQTAIAERAAFVRTLLGGLGHEQNDAVACPCFSLPAPAPAAIRLESTRSPKDVAHAESACCRTPDHRAGRAGRAVRRGDWGGRRADADGHRRGARVRVRVDGGGAALAAGA